ncbi:MULTISPECIES: glycolate oxidase subunit GlcE [Paraburkholderia]|jgi:glycolate oxidase FAD binding subunit|uniref:Glycolate oxidase subunit GlcE n=1 Tax=Paraburkholderia largidicola TaxID=3014751 RepID=A0A7I8BY77_9BURK|nr:MULTISPECIES: glycolate oxidase subunit GlcE [Paraburkholderia]BCF93355.1 glycolate oxidase subunit GlcE [Paraburkholderia sp. PGU16]BEU26532.1 glycolate oxidase subunit GlcE [Paraburkholderia sp. 22B1P]GJH05073.1 glycolate oxidase subunit GlcE [Paraburkholderia terrae]
MRREFDSMDDSARLVAQVQHAIAQHTPLRIRGSDSKRFLGRDVQGEELDTRSHRGIVTYDPTELVITARAGTPLVELNAALDDADQMLPCEPPLFDGKGTLGGAVATGLSGPRRPWAGSMRDFVLGCRVITGDGDHLRFGGQVMKNVAGYDMSRLLAGSFGSLGVLTEVSLKVLPKPRERRSFALTLGADEALRELSAWRKAALPVSGACYVDGRLYVRLEGGSGSVKSAVDRIGGDEIDCAFWDALRDHRLPFFADTRPLWRVSLPNATPLMQLPGDVLIDWAGAQRWVKSDASAAEIRQLAHAAGGHATCFTPSSEREPFQPLAAPLLRYQHQLKRRLDPNGVLNPGRLYADL